VSEQTCIGSFFFYKVMFIGQVLTKKS